MSESKKKVAAIGFFEKYLSNWVALCIIAGIAIGSSISNRCRSSCRSASYADTCSHRQQHTPPFPNIRLGGLSSNLLGFFVVSLP